MSYVIITKGRDPRFESGTSCHIAAIVDAKEEIEDTIADLDDQTSAKDIEYHVLKAKEFIVNKVVEPL